MNRLEYRLILFSLLCIPMRVSLVYYAYTANDENLRLLGYVASLISIGFMYIFLTGSRVTGAETFGKKIWWNSMRPIHSILYFCFAIMAIKSMKNAHIPLAIDVVLGFVAFIHNHFIKQT